MKRTEEIFLSTSFVYFLLLLFDRRRKRDTFSVVKNSTFFVSLFLTKIVPFSPLHTSVLKYEPLEALLSISKKDHRVFIDATLGLGGHSSELASRLSKNDLLVGLDRDNENLVLAEEVLKNTETLGTWKLFHTNFTEIQKVLSSLWKESFDGILYDLGVSSVHYDSAERGFSLRFDGPLDMRFDRTSSIPTAEEYLKKVDERVLFQVLKDFGDEPKAFFIAKAIVEARKTTNIDRTDVLKEIVAKASFDPKSAIRVFQAIRIAVNGELDHVAQSLHEAVRLLSPGGRIAVITFHSIEDRIVKNIFKSYETPKTDEFTGKILSPWILRKITKKPLIPSEEEIKNNPRARSAKLRILEKISPHER